MGVGAGYQGKPKRSELGDMEGPFSWGLLKAEFEPDQFSCPGSPPPSWLLLFQQTLPSGDESSIDVPRTERAGGTQGGSQAGGGRAIWGSWGASLLVLQLAARVPLAIVSNWLDAQPPKWQLGNQAEGGWGGYDPGSGGRWGWG